MQDAVDAPDDARERDGAAVAVAAVREEPGVRTVFDKEALQDEFWRDEDIRRLFHFGLQARL